MKFFKSGWFKFIIFLIVFICIAMVFYFKEDAPVSYRTATVSKGNIESYIEGSGVISASEARKVYSKVSSEVSEVFYDEGDYVNSGDVIAILDSSSYSSTVDSQKIAIEQAKLSISNIKKQINDLTIVANSSGYVSGLNISEGSYVTTTMQVCNIIEPESYEIVLPFPYSDVNKIQVGNNAKVTLVQNFASLEGVVTKVSEMRKLATGSSQVVDVTIKVPTSGYSLAGATAKGEVIVNGTKQFSASTGMFASVNLNMVRALSTGTVKSVNVYDGKYVNVGDVIAVLTNEDLNLSLNNANLTLQNLNSQYAAVKEQLDNYSVRAPISGTITSQSLSVGDMVAAGMVLTTVSNKDILEFTIPVDELDIAKIDYDKDVKVSIDALDDTKVNSINGVISKLPLEGVSTSGVTEYYVTIQIPGNDDIRISMSANAKIVISSKMDVLMVPIDAIENDENGSFVTVVLDDNTTVKKTVELGERNVSFIEVKSGLNEGDRVVVPETNSGFIF